MSKGWLKAEFDRVRALTTTAVPWVVVTRPLVNGRRITQPGEPKAEALLRKSDLPPGAVVWIGYRMAVKRAGELDEGYAWRYVDTGELVDYDNVYKCMWTVSDPASVKEGGQA